MMNSLRRNLYKYILIAFAAFAMSSCKGKELDFNDPDVDLFIEQLKDGSYNSKDFNGVVLVPRFTEDDIPELLERADDLTLIPSFPTMYNTASGKIRLGECLLWIVESIRLGMPVSQGCNMVEANADNYEAIYFLTDEQVLDAVKRYRYWWENRQYPQTEWTVDACYDEPLCGSGYRWW